MGAKKRVVGLALLTALAIMGDSMLLIVLPIQWEEFGLTAVWQIGVIFSINRFIRLPINPLIGLFYKKFQLRTGLLIAIALAAISTFSYGMSQTFWFLVIMRAVWGIAWSLLRLGGYLTVIDVSTKATRGKYMGLYNGLWGLGGLVGMLGGGILADQTSIVFVTSLFAMFALFGFPMILAFVPSKPKEEVETTSPQSPTSKTFTPYIWRVLFTGFTLGFIVFGLFATTLSPLVERSYTEAWSLFGLSIGAATLAGIIQAIKWGTDPLIASYTGKRLDASTNQIKILVLTVIAGGILLLILGFLPMMSLLIVFIFVFQIILTMFLTATDTLATNAAAQTGNSIKVITAHTIVVDVGAAMGPFLSYLVIEFFNITAVYVISSIFMFGLAAMWYVFEKGLKVNRKQVGSTPSI
ncbi:MFS transporter [Salirhabdus sp. Marseille-P4669]|uniref:MFS transporter n=1 Tax=Salirhabdus sp. Marseille-P4669 TaxID=2042310 RepID=UPI000C7E78B4|nr:MFS transporter [Salirhabdus sp. Marseille-P4669]